MFFTFERELATLGGVYWKAVLILGLFIIFVLVLILVFFLICLISPPADNGVQAGSDPMPCLNVIR